MILREGEDNARGRVQKKGRKEEEGRKRANINKLGKKRERERESEGKCIKEMMELGRGRWRGGR